MLIQPGVVAPDLEMQDLEGQSQSIGQYRGRPLLLQFYRYASCPMCDLRLHDFSREYPRLREMGLEVIAIFHSSPRRLRSHFGGRRLPFTIVADPSRHLYRRYGVETSWIKFLLSMLKPSFYWDWLRSMRHGFFGGVDWQLASMPADFLIGPDGTVLEVHYGRDIGDHMPVHQIEQALSRVAGGHSQATAHSASVSNPASNASGRPFAAVVALTLLWAFALIASSYFLKGRAVGEWVDASLYLAAGLWLGASVLRIPTSHRA